MMVIYIRHGELSEEEELKKRVARQCRRNHAISQEQLVYIGGHPSISKMAAWGRATSQREAQGDSAVVQVNTALGF